MAYTNASDIDILCKGTLYDLTLFAKNQGYNFSCNVIDFENYYHYGTANRSVLNLQDVTSDMVLLETSSGKIELKMDGVYLIDLHITDANNRHFQKRVINKTNTGATYFTIYFGIDETNQLGSIAILTWRSGSNANFEAFGDSQGNGFYNNSYAYNLIKGLVPPTYTWQSVPSISGKNGILSLTHVRNDSLLDGGSQTFTPDQVTVTEESRVGRIMANVPVDKAIKAIFSGVANYLGIHKDTSTTFTVIMQLVEHITRRIYLKSFVTDKCYIGFIMDTEQQAARVGIFYPQYEPLTEILTGYSVNFTDTDYSETDIYTWLQGGIDADTPEINQPDNGTPEDYQPDIPITGIVKPSYGAIETGFTTMFRCSKGELQRLSAFLWSA